MPTDNLAEIISLILALSIASERLVEIIKGLIPWLSSPKEDPHKEGRRKAALQVLAVLSAIATAFLAKDYIPVELGKSVSGGSILGLGLLASGGSGLWNSVLTYFGNIKDIAKAHKIEAHRNLS